MSIDTTPADPPARLQFREAHAEDVPAIVALVESAYRGDASRRGWTTEADLLDGQRTDAAGVAELLARPDSRLLLAEREGSLLGCCHLERQAEACYFGMFAVAPGLQGGGVGGAILAEAERLAREAWHCVRMEMTVITVRDELIAWYVRRGYRRTGALRPFPYGDERFGRPRRADLEFEVLAKPLV